MLPTSVTSNTEWQSKGKNTHYQPSWVCMWEYWFVLDLNRWIKCSIKSLTLRFCEKYCKTNHDSRMCFWNVRRVQSESKDKKTIVLMCLKNGKYVVRTWKIKTYSNRKIKIKLFFMMYLFFRNKEYSVQNERSMSRSTFRCRCCNTHSLNLHYHLFYYHGATSRC